MTLSSSYLLLGYAHIDMMFPAISSLSKFHCSAIEGRAILIYILKTDEELFLNHE
ncbi:MAG: hypothetical protein ACKVI6_04490 [Candidatus Poseidoniales archaeon]|jgi:hypothetical protein|tara:strand:+ start:694 stop:858 length:165 start_codon:yes stop_codon:yes gene_type:complete